MRNVNNRLLTFGRQAGCVFKLNESWLWWSQTQIQQLLVGTKQHKHIKVLSFNAKKGIFIEILADFNAHSKIVHFQFDQMKAKWLKCKLTATDGEIKNQIQNFAGLRELFAFTVAELT